MTGINNQVLSESIQNMIQKMNTVSEDGMMETINGNEKIRLDFE